MSSPTEVAAEPCDKDDLAALHEVTEVPENEEEEEEEEEEETIMEAQRDGNIPVGITIAYKRREEGFSDPNSLFVEKMTSKNARPVQSNNKPRTPKVTKPKSIKNHRSSLQVFVESALIYLLCILLPTLLAFLAQHLENGWRRWQSGSLTFLNDDEDASSESILSSSSSTYSDFLYSYLNESPTYQYWMETTYRPSMQYVCTAASAPANAPIGSSSYYSTAAFVSSLLQQSGLCPEPLVPDTFHRSVVSEDLSIYTDLFYISLCSILLAVLRIAILQSNTKMQHQDVDSITILVRCKSNHLLSSDYHVVSSSVVGTPVYQGTPVSKPRRLPEVVSTSDAAAALAQIVLPDLTTTRRSATGADNKVLPPRSPLADRDMDQEHPPMEEEEEEEDLFGYHIDFSERRLDELDLEEDEDEDLLDRSSKTETMSDAPVRMNPLAVGTPTRRRSLVSGIDVSAVDSENDPFSNSLRSRLEQEQRRSMYKISRYTTALFRLLYCSVTVGIAMVYFRHADFWPWYVGGQGDTSQCWDLSGGITVGGMDSDFDHYNVVLKRYFLWQASYHIHSSTFHFLLSLLFLFNPLSSPSQNPLMSLSSSDSPSSKRLHSFRKGSNAYVRSFVQHVLSVLLILIAYTFSSLRRLGAIGLFAFDISSWSLHLLQIVINAPADSHVILWIRNRNFNPSTVVSCIYRLLVIPSFIIARFIIWPLLWYSMIAESTQWLRQLEMTLWSGSALQLRCIIHSLMFSLHALSILYFRRLLSYQYKIQSPSQ